VDCGEEGPLSESEPNSKNVNSVSPTSNENSWKPKTISKLVPLSRERLVPSLASAILYQTARVYRNVAFSKSKSTPKAFVHPVIPESTKSAWGVPFLSDPQAINKFPDVGSVIVISAGLSEGLENTYCSRIAILLYSIKPICLYCIYYSLHNLTTTHPNELKLVPLYICQDAASAATFVVPVLYSILVSVP
jgi:hypothetical protein